MSTGSVWACKTCAKTFSRKGDLTRHTHLHTGYKPYVCRDCGKAFAQFSGLKTHRNVHTKVKPFACGMNGCVAVFGDPSSCTRHRKERHQIIGAYQCPVSHCKSSIKRRSAFMQHLRKHKIDPATVDLDALAPTLLPRQIIDRRKPQPYLPIDIKPPNTTHNILYSNSIPYYNDVYSNAPSYNPSSHYHHTTDGWFSTPCRPSQSLGMSPILTDELYTISAASSPPALDFSMSPSPTPSRSDLVRTPEATQPNITNYTAPHSLCTSPNSSLGPLSQFSPYFFSELGHTQKRPNWDADTLFGNSVIPQF